MHVAKGVPCQTCHGQDLQKPREPSDKTCFGCHNRDALIEKTKDLHPVVNPHNPPHNGECIQCHLQHSDPVNNCADCHKYDFKMKAIQ